MDRQNRQNISFCDKCCGELNLEVFIFAGKSKKARKIDDFRTMNTPYYGLYWPFTYKLDFLPEMKLEQFVSHPFGKHHFFVNLHVQ